MRTSVRTICAEIFRSWLESNIAAVSRGHNPSFWTMEQGTIEGHGHMIDPDRMRMRREERANGYDRPQQQPIDVLPRHQRWGWRSDPQKRSNRGPFCNP
jgi:hypothetical protein